MNHFLKTALLLGLLLTGCAKKSQTDVAGAAGADASPVRTANVSQSEVPLDFSAVGNVESMASVDVKSRVAGQVLRVAFQEGQDVKKDQLLFEVDPEPTRRQIAELQANLSKDIALEEQAKANVAKDEAQIKQTRAAAERGVQLAKEGIFSREQTEQVVATNDAAIASLEADKAAIGSAQASINADRARLGQTELQLGYTRILAPISGRAGAINIKAGNLIKDNDAAMVTLLEVSPIYVTFSVPERLLPQLHQGLTVLADGRQGVLKFIDNTVDTNTGTIKLKAVFENADHHLWPGQFVNAEARLAVEKDRMLVPSRAVETGPQGKYVWVVNHDDSVAMRPVEVLRVYKTNGADEESVIGSGLKAGETVVSDGQMRLMPGAKVRVLKEVTDAFH